ncbi:hypothetical protein HNQ59_002888 [Chitinivorax tropicus]|uniref:Ice-binding protein C-terminal domain-containing protein n=1 Tax=Chitinivorax tropicus TaxID=714531 RepID=A0A840MT68_9PROT|nr:PEP-CTERM sorting domain-containing protein [Chitinivorax tropicus]MBB5019586.1 hypothetical protein [Chitinivorax tropicus]
MVISPALADDRSQSFALGLLVGGTVHEQHVSQRKDRSAAFIDVIDFSMDSFSRLGAQFLPSADPGSLAQRRLGRYDVVNHLLIDMSMGEPPKALSVGGYHQQADGWIIGGQVAEGRVSPVPEPSVGLMLLAGLGVVGLAIMRRKRQL